MTHPRLSRPAAAFGARPNRILLALLSSLGVVGAANAQTPPSDVQSVVIVGTRRPATSMTDTALPVDVINLGPLAERSPQFDLAQLMANLSPSFNSSRQNGADGADLVDSVALRGLASDQTLVLVNGKRRHTAALVNLFGARNRGSTGTDMNAIPVMAIDNVQVLRDGASAQYGSDAIAGVINVALKRRTGCEAALGGGQYRVGDGKNGLATGYCGFGVGDGGVLGLTAEYADRGRSNRAEAGNPRIIGDSLVRNATFYANGELPTGGDGRLYVTLGVQRRDASSAAWARGGVGSDDIPSRNSAAMYPDGFVPFIGAAVDDRWATLGWRSVLGGWRTDVSQTYGFNEMRYDVSRTLNASIANKDLLAGGKGLSPSRFDAGGFSFQQSTTNVDFSRFHPDVLQGLNVAAGLEVRQERYRIVAGEPGSYNDVDGVGFGGNAGSQGFPGFQPGDATNRSRRSWAGYVDLEADVTQALKLSTALRHERYGDFGSTTNGKLAAAFRVSPSTLLRGAVSTGFRAPSLQQVYFSSTFTDFISGKPMDVVLAPNGGAIANAAGIPKLKQEESTNVTLGFTFKPTAQTALTFDAYRIDIKDRIVLSGRFDENNFPKLGAALAALGVGQAQFFVNSVDTKTQGFDLTASHRTELGTAGRLATYLAFNASRTRVKNVHAPAALAGYEDVLLSERERLFMEQGGPSRKGTLSFNHALGRLETDFKVIHYGPQTLGTFSGTAAGVPNATYAPRTSADLAFTWNFDRDTKLTLGGSNIFDVKPSPQDPNETDNGFKYDSVQFGLNGAAYFARFWKRF